jgi:hypothetical protein
MNINIKRIESSVDFCGGKEMKTEPSTNIEPDTQSYSSIAICDMDTRDVERSPIVYTILRIISEFDQSSYDGSFSKQNLVENKFQGNNIDAALIPIATYKCNCSQEKNKCNSDQGSLTTNFKDDHRSFEKFGLMPRIEVKQNYKDSDPL